MIHPSFGKSRRDSALEIKSCIDLPKHCLGSVPKHIVILVSHQSQTSLDFGFGCLQVTQPTPSEKKNPKDSDEAKSDSVRHLDREDMYSREELSSWTVRVHTSNTTIVLFEPPRIYRVFYVGDPSSIVLKNQDFKDQGSTKTQGHEKENPRSPHILPRTSRSSHADL